MKRLLFTLLFLPTLALGANIPGSSVRLTTPAGATLSNVVDGSYTATLEPLDIQMTEQTDPAAPAANKAILYVRDNGAGKTQLVVRFPSGAVHVVATEP